MKKIVLLFVLCCIMVSVKAQYEEADVDNSKGLKKENVFVGGYLGLTFGDYTLINVSPQVGYRFTRYFAMGLGLNGQYINYKDRDVNGEVYRKVSQGVAGLSLFGRFYPINNFDLFLQAQPEANYIFGNETYYQPAKEEYKLDAMIAPSLLLGGGVVLNSGSKGGVVISIMYDVLQHEDSPYETHKPIYNVGFSIGL
jgi:hypothetical protein